MPLDLGGEREGAERTQARGQQEARPGQVELASTRAARGALLAVRRRRDTLLVNTSRNISKKVTDTPYFPRPGIVI